jgi:hypothetical protein
LWGGGGGGGRKSFLTRQLDFDSDIAKVSTIQSHRGGWNKPCWSRIRPGASTICETHQQRWAIICLNMGWDTRIKERSTRPLFLSPGSSGLTRYNIILMQCSKVGTQIFFCYSANSKSANSWAYSTIASPQFLKCAIPGITNPQI